LLQINILSITGLAKVIRITHNETKEILAEGRIGWGITPFEGNYYISNKNLITKGFKTSYLPGICPYKFLYLWLNFHRDDGKVDKMLGWKYVLPNPIFPFIWFRVAVPSYHPMLKVEELKNY